jgi:hypothetical protein
MILSVAVTRPGAIGAREAGKIFRAAAAISQMKISQRLNEAPIVAAGVVEAGKCLFDEKCI